VVPETSAQEAVPAPATVPVAEVVPEAKPESVVAPIAPIAVPVPEVDLTADLNQAGLVMIETTGAKPAVTPVATAAPVLGRKPKPPVVIAAEPLQMVETRHD
jgi:hypothetical protein